MTVAIDVATETTVLAGRGLRRFLRSPQLVVYTLALPLLLLFMMLAVFGRIVGDATHTPYAARLTPAVVLFATASGSVVTGVGFFTDLHTGLTDRLRTMPVSRIAPLLGRIVGDLTRILAASLVACAVAYLPGFRFHRGPAAAVGFFAVVLLFATIFLWIALLIALTAKSEEGVNSALTAPATLLLFFSSGFVPSNAFPGAVHPIVAANPLSCATNAAIGLSSGGPLLAPVLQTAAWACAVAAVAAPLTVRLYHRRGGKPARR